VEELNELQNWTSAQSLIRKEIKKGYKVTAYTLLNTISRNTFMDF
jgi:hypothetical protein